MAKKAQELAPSPARAARLCTRTRSVSAPGATKPDEPVLGDWNRNIPLSVAVWAITLAMLGWAAPVGAAHLSARLHTSVKPSASLQAPRSATPQIPRPVYFREVPGRGLLVGLWINGRGPYNVVIDTGAGATIVSSRVATEANIFVLRNRSNKIAGLSGIMSTATATEVRPEVVAIGDRDNFLPRNGTVLVADIFPSGIDGLLDPTEGYWPLGYVIDFPERELAAFDPRVNPLRSSYEPAGGAVVPWLRDSNSRRPYVMLDDGQKALLDTGSEFGLALSDSSLYDSRRSSNRAVRDVGGGTLSARRVAPMTVAIGSLTLRGVPTDLVAGTERGAPVLLGRAALRPFRISFDPISRLIEIAPGH